MIINWYRDKVAMQKFDSFHVTERFEESKSAVKNSKTSLALSTKSESASHPKSNTKRPRRSTSRS